jgi:hypothetical protein
MSNRFQKFFETTEKEAKQRTISETGIRLYENGRPMNYETSVYYKGSSDVLVWMNTHGEEKHRLRHKCGSFVRLCVKPKNGNWLARIEVKPEMSKYEQIKKSLEDNGWEQTTVRGLRTKLK